MSAPEALTRNRRRLSSAAISNEHGSSSAIEANRFSAEASVATLVRGVTTSTASAAGGRGERFRQLTTSRMDQPFGAHARGELRQLARRGGGQAVFRRAGFDGERHPCAAREQQALALVRAEHVLAFVRAQLKGVRHGVDGRGVLLQEQL